MIDLYLRSLLLAALVLLALALARRASAAVRHAVVVAGLTAALALPLLSLLVPPVRLPVLPAPATITTVQVASVPISNTVVAVPVAAQPTPSSERPSFPLWALWALGSLILLLRWAAALLALCRRLAGASPLEGLGASVPVVESGLVRTPMVAWTPRARIVLPLDWREWSAERLDVALRHEAAHLSRGDGLSLLVARLALAALWPNPLVWILARMESRLAESATDDLVVTGGIPAPTYARHLLAIAQEAHATGPLPALGMARKAAVAHRIEMILKPQTPRTLVTSKTRRFALFAALALSIPVAVGALDPSSSLQGATSAQELSAAAPLTHPVLLRCQIVRTERDQDGPYTRAWETPPTLLGQPQAHVLETTDLRLVSTGEATLRTSLGGQILRLVLSPTRRGVGSWHLYATQFVGAGASEKPRSSGAMNMEENGWAQIRLPDVPNDPHAYLALIKLVPLAPIPQAVPATNKPANGIAVTAVADPLAFVLRCEVVRAPQQGAVATKGSATKPVLAGAESTTVLRAPDLYTGNGIRSAVKVTLDGIERTVELRPSTGDDLKSTLQIGMSMPFQGARMGYNDLFYAVPANGWVRYPINDISGRYVGYQMLVQASPYKGDAPTNAPTAEAGDPVLVQFKIVHADGLKGSLTSVTAAEPVVGDPRSVKVLAEPKISTREGVAGSLELSGGDPSLKVAVQIVPGPGGKRMAFLDGKLHRKGLPGQNLTVFSSLSEGQWLRTPFRDTAGKFHGDQLLVRFNRTK